MKLFEHRKTVKPVNRCFPDSGWPERFQQLVQTTYLFGVPVNRLVLDEEKVPSYVVIEAATLGAYLGSWRSKFIEYF